MTTLDKAIGSLTGLAVGDALGTTVEFKERNTFEELTDMIGKGVFRLEPGQWTDDTSLALCLAESLINNTGLDSSHFMSLVIKWYENGYMSSNGRCFDIGRTTANAITDFKQTGIPIARDTHFTSAGNGSIMRLSPAAILEHRDIEVAVELAANQSMVTHAAQECVESCRILSWVLVQLINGMTKEQLFKNEFNELADHLDIKSPNLKSILNYDFLNKSRDQINSSGYVVHTLEAALWSVYSTDSFKSAVLIAANLGDDADTVAAVTGQIAGALYGHSSIPENWWNLITHKNMILNMAQILYQLKG